MLSQDCVTSDGVYKIETKEGKIKTKRKIYFLTLPDTKG